MMAIFKLEIRLDNAAFHDDDGDFSPEMEIIRILNEVTGHVGFGYSQREVRDINGNLAGEWRIEE